MKIDKVLNGSLDEQTFFGERDKAFLLASAPDSKLSLNLNYNKNWFDAGLTFTRFSEVQLLDFQMFEDPADYGGFNQQIIAATDTYEAQEPVSDEIYYIVPDKCTECKGFHEEPQCAAVCPVDCCVPDDSHVETEEALLGKQRFMHPEE